MMKLLFRGLFFFLLLASVYFSLKQATDDIPNFFAADKVVHLLSYFLLMLSLDFSFKSSNAIVWKGVAVIIYSAMLEIGQGYVPGRETSLLDMVANSFGVLMFIFCVPLLKRRNIYRKLSL